MVEGGDGCNSLIVGGDNCNLLIVGGDRCTRAESQFQLFKIGYNINVLCNSCNGCR